MYSFSNYGQKKEISFLALGDSYTIGTSELPKNSWPNQLKDMLDKKGFSTKTTILAKAGWTSEQLLVAVKKSKIKPDFDLVSLFIGVNNQYRSQDIKSFKSDFSILLEKSIELAKNNASKVFVISIPDWSVTPFAKFKDKSKITKELKEYNDFIKQEAKEQGVLYIDITQLSRNAEVNSSLIASDSLHPSKKMYKSWVKKINKKILKKLD